MAEDNLLLKSRFTVLSICLILSLISLPLSGIPRQYLFTALLTSKWTYVSPVSAFIFHTSPKLNQLMFHIREFGITGNNNSAPLYPLYDRNRNVVWIGDSGVDSSRILEFNLTSGKFTVHKLNGTSLVTVMALDHNDSRVWYVDPLMKHLGLYDPSANSTKLYNIPTNGTISRIAVDSNNDIWLTSPDTNEVLKFNSQVKNFTMIHLPTTNAMPIGVLFDKTSGMIWIAEGIGKIASIDPIRNYKISEYPLMAMDNHTRYSPTELFMDTYGDNNLFISNHDNHTISSFNTKLKTFRSYPVFNPNALPFGMAMDKNGYLWMAEHTTNKIAVIDPKTGYIREIQLPSTSPYIQFLTSDSKGNTWFVEEHGNSLGVITSSVSKAS